jgi:hypothetical protein
MTIWKILDPSTKKKILTVMTAAKARDRKERPRSSAPRRRTTA